MNGEFRMKNEASRIGSCKAARRVNVWLGWLIFSAPFSILLLAGCDSVFTAAAQGGEASLRTLIDILLTDFTNQVADTLTGEGDSQPDDGDQQADDGDGDDEGTDGDDDGTLDPDGDVSFDDQIQPILNARCIACHAPGGFAQLLGIPWDYTEGSSFHDLVNQASSQDASFTMIVPGDPDASLLFLKVTQESPPIGDMMPLGGPPLEDSEVELFRLWILQGAMIGGQGDSGPDADDSDSGSVAGGETLFVANNCGGCHCADATGGCALAAPALVGATLETLTDFLTGIEPHTGGQFALSDQDLADLQAYLASL